MVLFNLYDDWLKSIPSYTVRIIIIIMRSQSLIIYCTCKHKIFFILYYFFQTVNYCTLLFLLGIFQINPHPKSSSCEH